MTSSELQAMAVDMAEALKYELLAKYAVTLTDAQALDLARNALQSIADRIEEAVQNDIDEAANMIEPDSDRTLGLSRGIFR